VDPLVLEAAADGAVAAEQLPEEVRAAPRRVLLFAGDHVARAHDVVIAGALAVLAAAFADAHAAERRAREAPAVVGISKMGLGPRRPVVRPEAHVIDDRIRVDDLAGFIRPCGSKIAFNSRIASISSGPNIFTSSSARDCPSPCSPDSEPPYATTRSAASDMNPRNASTPPSV